MEDFLQIRENQAGFCNKSREFMGIITSCREEKQAAISKA